MDNGDRGNGNAARWVPPELTLANRADGNDVVDEAITVINGEKPDHDA